MLTHNVVDSGIRGLFKSSAFRQRRVLKQSDSLCVELLDTAACLELVPELEAFEHSVFGPDFAIAPAEMRAWAESGSWFCAAVTGQAVVGRRQIFSMLSILVSSAQSRDRLLAGKCAEGQLQSWTRDPHNDEPALYLASVISAASDHLGGMYQSVARDLREFQTRWGIEFHSGFSIASGPAGFSHMARNGFRAVKAQSYRGQYPVMVIDPKSAATRFWQDLLGSQTSKVPRIATETPNKSASFPVVGLVT